MNDSQSKPPSAWDPLTPRGVASFARASLGRLLLVQGLVAVLAGIAMVWFLASDWFPIVRAAIRQLPATGEIKDEQLNWDGESPVLLAGNHFLGIAVDMNHSGVLSREAQLQIEFGRRDLRVIGLLGYTPVEYVPGARMPFNRPELGPWWGAWQPVLLLGAGVGMVVALLLSWTLLATLYALPVRLIAFLENRDLTMAQSWRLASAALMPGALFFTFVIFCYSFGMVDLVRLAILGVMHLLIGWVYLFVSPLFLPKPVAAIVIPKENPFVPARKKGEAQPEKSSNPFSTSENTREKSDGPPINPENR